MTEDFDAGLRDLYSRAAAAHASGDGFPTTAMAGRVRRNRRVRAAAVSMATVAAVVVVGLGGAAAVRNLADDAPVAPAETTTPSPTDQADQTPAGVLTCGTMIGDIPLLQDPPVTIEATIDPATVTAAGPLLGSVVIAAVEPPGPTIMTDVVLGLRYLVVQDGEVVGIGRDNGDVGVLSGRNGVVREFAVLWTGCDEDGRTTAELPVGEYDLYAGFQALAAGGVDTEELDSDGVLLGGPWPFTITEDAPPDASTHPPAESDMPLSAPGEHIPDSNVSAIPPSSDPTVPLADGDYFGHLAGVDVTAGTVDVDIEIIYFGPAASDYLTANDPTAENPPPNGYIIVNGSTQLRTLTLSDDVRVWDWCSDASAGALGFAERDVAEWAAAPAEGETSCDAGVTLSHGWNEVYWFQVRDAEVKQVIGQYLP